MDDEVGLGTQFIGENSMYLGILSERQVIVQNSIVKRFANNKMVRCHIPV